MAKRNFYVSENQLDDFQLGVINRKTDSSLLVKGCAGSGKTLLALLKAKRITDAGEGSVIFIVLTKALLRFISDAVQEMNFKENFQCFSYHQWLGRGSPAADFVFVDEATDFDAGKIGEFQNAARRALFLYGDSAQQLYTFDRSRTALSMEELKAQTDFALTSLNNNHRLPAKVARLAKYLNTELDLSGESPSALPFTCIYEGVSLPKVLLLPNFVAQLEFIKAQVENRGLQDVGILLRSNEEVEATFQYLAGMGLMAERKFNSTAEQSVMTLDFHSVRPKIMTYHSAKGLQFETVFVLLPGFYGTGTYLSSEEVKALYVATTRTYDELFILHTTPLPPILGRIPSDLYEDKLSSGSTPRY